MSLSSCKIILLFLLVTLAGCNSLVFFPQSEYVRTPADINLAYTEERIRVDEDTSLNSWLLKSKTPGSPKGTILFLHGNAENISTHIASVHWLPERGYQVLLLDYRGFGSSDDSPNFNKTIEDIRKVILFLKKKTGEKIIVFGQSIGASLAVPALAMGDTQTFVKGVILDSPLSNYRLIAREKLGSSWLTWAFKWPLCFLLSNEYAPERWIEKLNIPALLVHSTADEIISINHSETLAKKMEGKKCFQFIYFEKSKHIQIFQNEQARAKFIAFLESLNSADCSN